MRGSDWNTSGAAGGGELRAAEVGDVPGGGDPRTAGGGDPRTPAGGGDPRGTLRLLADPNFGPYLGAKLLSSIGVWVYNVVAAVVVFDLTGSAAMVGAVSVAMFLPQVLLAPLAGARADRGSHRRQLAGSRVVVAGGAGALAAWVAFGGLDGAGSAWLVIGAGLVVGTGFAVGGPAAHALLPSLVRPSELSGAVALAQTPFTVARAVGPALGAGLLAVAGAAAGFAFAAVGNAVYAVAAWRVRLRPVERAVDVDRSVRAGLRHLRWDPVCALLLLAVAATGFGVDPVITLTPSIADELGGGERLVGAMASAFGAGAAVSALASGAVRRRVTIPRLAPAGFVGFALGLAGLAMAPGLEGLATAPGLAWLGAVPAAAWAVASLVVAGSGMIFAVTSLTTQLQARLPEHLRGRIMALWMVAFVGSRPLAAAINGSVADAVSVQLALLIGVGVLVAGGVVSRPRATARTVPAVAGAGGGVSQA